MASTNRTPSSTRTPGRRRPAPHARRAALVVAALVAGAAPVTLAIEPAAAAPPDAPTGLLAIASPGSARLAWYDPGDDGGFDITEYTVRASTGQIYHLPATALGPATLSGLSNGVTVTFQVAATNQSGTGPYSTASNAVTPSAATATNRFTPAASMVRARDSAKAVRLASGNVLVIGGLTETMVVRRTTELYRPATNSWSSTASMDLARIGFTATKLADGRVLVTGGRADMEGGAVRASVRIYRPASGTWANAAPMSRPRVGHSATLLSDGTVLVVGGDVGFAVTPSAEIYHPSTNTWTSAASLATARYLHSATRLLDGRVLVAGGSDGIAGLRSAELYDPATGTWAATGDMTTLRESDEICCKRTVRLPSGKVLAAGGWAGGPLRTAELFDPATGVWTPTGAMQVGREAGFALVLLPNGKVLVAGGYDSFGSLGYAELYNESTGQWTRVNDLIHRRGAPMTVVLKSGKVLVAGSAGRSAELFQPA